MSCVRIELVNDLEVSEIEFASDLCSFVVPPIDPPASIILAEMLRGPPGGSAPAEGYLHTQMSPSATWTINHNLGVKPNISLYTTGGVEFDGQVTHASDNQAVINLEASLAGFARCI